MELIFLGKILNVLLKSDSFERDPVDFIMSCFKNIIFLIKRIWGGCVYEYCSAIKKSEIMPFAATWMQLEIITLSEVSHKEIDKYHMISLICGI